MKYNALNSLKEYVDSQALDPYLKPELLKSVQDQFELRKALTMQKIPLNEQDLEQLLPSELTSKQLSQLLTEIEVLARQNEYLVSFLESLHQEDGHQIACCLGENKLQRDKNLASLLCFAFVLERMNKVANDSPEKLAFFVSHFQGLRREKNYYRLANILGIIKLHSIELPLTKYLKAYKASKIPKAFSKFLLSFNIFEALLVDLVTGLFKNAYTAWILIKFPPYFKGLIFKKYQKGKPASFAFEKSTLQLFSPNQRQWADLYQVWNMAFVSQFQGSLFLLVKLFIPSVLAYQNKPQQYMHKRITAMHFAMHFLDFAQSDNCLPIEVAKVRAFPKYITNSWASFNKTASLQYNDLNKAPPSKN